MEVPGINALIAGEGGNEREAHAILLPPGLLEAAEGDQTKAKPRELEPSPGQTVLEDIITRPPDAVIANPQQDRTASIAHPPSPLPQAWHHTASIPRRKQTNQSTISRNFSRTINGVIRPSVASVRQTYTRAEKQHKRVQRSAWRRAVFQASIYGLILAFVYFVLVGRPLWGGTIWYTYILFTDKFTFVGGSAIFVGLAFFYAFGPLLILFDVPAPTTPVVEKLAHADSEESLFPPAPFVRVFPTDKEKELRRSLKSPNSGYSSGAVSTALLIPCYKSAQILPATLDAALKVFPAQNIFILNNSRSAQPPDDTPAICDTYGVNHIYIPIGSKLVAQYVGAHLVRSTHPYCLYIDDDCLLPPNIPIVTGMLTKTVGCVGYTLKSVGAGGSLGTWCQQAQDFEYKLSGLQRQFAGIIGSATFPHGAIALWDVRLLLRTFKEHPGFNISEDWFFGHVARELGSRIKMCSSVFVETEAPANFIWAPKGAARGGFGEMTVYKQRFSRWNFFFVNGCYYNLAYILFSWKLGWWEIGAKIFVFQEVYETVLYLITPIVTPISFIARPTYSAYLFLGTMALYLINSIVFNAIHLRRSKQQVSWSMLFLYYIPFKLALTVVNVMSCWWNLFIYAKYFSKRHLKVVDDPQAVGVVLKIAEDRQSELDKKQRALKEDRLGLQRGSLRRPRRMTVEAIKVGMAPGTEEACLDADEDEGPTRLVPIAEDPAPQRGGGGTIQVGAFDYLERWAPAWTRTNSDRRRDLRRMLSANSDGSKIAPDEQ